MGKLKRAQEIRIDEFWNELRESHATIQELTSQIQELQEIMNYMNVSKECQEKESTCIGKLSDVPSQPSVDPSPRSMSSSDQSLRPDTWNLEHRETFLANHVQYSIRHQHLIKECFTLGIKVLLAIAQCENVQGKPVARGEERNRETVPTPRFVRRPSPAEGAYPQNCMADQSRLQISELQFDKIPLTFTFSYWKIRFKTQLSACSSSPSEAMLWINEVEMVDSVDDLKSSRSIQVYTHFPNFEMLDARNASALNKIIQNSYFKKKVSLEEQKAQKEDRILRRRQIAYMIDDYFRVTGAHDTVLDCADLFSVTLHDDNIQEFDTRWDEILLSMTKSQPNDVPESLYKLRIRESV